MKWLICKYLACVISPPRGRSRPCSLQPSWKGLSHKAFLYRGLPSVESFPFCNILHNFHRGLKSAFYRFLRFKIWLNGNFHTRFQSCFLLRGWRESSGSVLEKGMLHIHKKRRWGTFVKIKLRHQVILKLSRCFYKILFPGWIEVSSTKLFWSIIYLCVAFSICSIVVHFHNVWNGFHLNLTFRAVGVRTGLVWYVTLE